MYREDETGGSFMLGVLTGAFVGAGLALLFAPKAGNEIRAQLGEQARGLADRVGEQTQHLRNAAGQLREQGRERMQEMSNQWSDRSTSDRQGTATSETERFPSSAPSV
jgi:gas vesicle protein